VEPGAELVLLDLDEVSFIDCAGVRLLLDADRRAAFASARLLIAPGASSLIWVLGPLGFDHRLQFGTQSGGHSRRHHEQPSRDSRRRAYAGPWRR